MLDLSLPDFGLGTLFAAISRLEARHDGMFYHHGKLIVFVAIYFLYVKIVTWVDRDALRFDQPRQMWALTLIGACGLSLFLMAMIPHFGITFLLSLLLLLSPTLVYVSQRNKKVPPQLRVLTRRHLNEVLNQLLGLSLKSPAAKAEKKGIPVRFIGKLSGQGDMDDSRMAKSAQAEGYRAAQELVWNALQMRATDIHMEPAREEVVVRYRVDGMLQSAINYDNKRGILVVNVFKNLASLDIAEKRKPQDGSFSAEVDGDRKVDFRVATSGSVHGEKLVMRLLDSSKQMTSLEDVGMRAVMREKLGAIIQQSYGMLITCGPTGAGKTSTLYACMNEIDRLQRNVITLENPVEYLIDHVTQIEVNTKAGKTFAAELRSILRQDPDVILIGEVRDAETAEIACQAAQTGHMVFTTLHANDTITALGRLIDLGVKPFMVATAVSAILGQRLARVLCPKCKVAYKPTAEVLKKLRLPADKVPKLYKPKETKRPESVEEPDEDAPIQLDSAVCERCHGTGYVGRVGIFEVLILNDEIRNMIRQNPDMVAIKQASIKAGLVSLMDDGARKVAEGIISVEELYRVAK